MPRDGPTPFSPADPITSTIAALSYLLYRYGGCFMTVSNNDEVLFDHIYIHFIVK